MRECLRCKSEMIENFDVKVESAAYGLKITKPGIFKDNLARCIARSAQTADTQKCISIIHQKLPKGDTL